jgi:hypothetical protein
VANRKSGRLAASESPFSAYINGSRPLLIEEFARIGVRQQLSMTKLAETCGTTYRSLLHTFSKSKRLNPKTVEQLQRALGVKPALVRALQDAEYDARQACYVLSGASLTRADMLEAWDLIEHLIKWDDSLRRTVSAREFTERVRAIMNALDDGTRRRVYATVLFKRLHTRTLDEAREPFDRTRLSPEVQGLLKILAAEPLASGLFEFIGPKGSKPDDRLYWLADSCRTAGIPDEYFNRVLLPNIQAYFDESGQSENYSKMLAYYRMETAT